MKDKIKIVGVKYSNDWANFTASDKRIINMNTKTYPQSKEFVIGQEIELEVKESNGKYYASPIKQFQQFPNQSETNKKICALNNATLLASTGKVNLKDLTKSYEKLLKLLNS